jgi:NAD(P)-dependent dehydrogenase (short-subunit alcohol dehydrogenase family)
MMMNKNGHWTSKNIPDQHGRLAVITGANSGLGFQTSRALAAKGARVVMACRDLAKGQVAADQILTTVPAADLQVMALDLASLDSVRAFAATLKDRYPALDLLVNNAGVMAIPFRNTADGFEMQFGVNHLGHFALTGLLLEALLATDHSRVVTVSSGMHLSGKINLKDLNSENGYSKWGAYGQSKLANLLFAYELQRRLSQGNYQTISVAAHPGYAATNLQSAGPRMEKNTLQGSMMNVANRLFAQSAEMGALPTLYAATAPDVNGCDYIGPGSMMGMRGYPHKASSSLASYDPELAYQLWLTSEQMTGVSYAFLNGRS